VTGLGALARESGTFLMVAMDQRESLRAMLGEHHPAPVEDARLVGFKLAVARELSPYASGLLIDRDFGFEPLVREGALAAGCGLMLAADAIVAEPGNPVGDTTLDSGLDLDRAAAAGVVALKFLVVWRDDGERRRRLEFAARFVELARAAGLVSIVEGVVRPAAGGGPFDRDEAIVEAARELAAVGPSLYKVEVPLHGRGDPAELERRCREIDAAVGCPWVVLSSGVDPEDFPAAVETACRAGASGILAGRAVWRDTLAADDPAELLRERSVPRLLRLAEIVDRHGRPWEES
jgi:sulfofructosephosphate aldolase